MADAIERAVERALLGRTVADSDRLAEITRRLEQVRSTKEYPTTVTMWSQILISVILPQALNMTVQATG